MNRTAGQEGSFGEPRPPEGGHCPQCGVRMFGGLIGHPCTQCALRNWQQRNFETRGPLDAPIAYPGKLRPATAEELES